MCFTASLVILLGKPLRRIRGCQLLPTMQPLVNFVEHLHSAKHTFDTLKCKPGSIISICLSLKWIFTLRINFQPPFPTTQIVLSFFLILCTVFSSTPHAHHLPMLEPNSCACCTQTFEIDSCTDSSQVIYLANHILILNVCNKCL